MKAERDPGVLKMHNHPNHILSMLGPKISTRGPAGAMPASVPQDVARNRLRTSPKEKQAVVLKVRSSLAPLSNKTPEVTLRHVCTHPKYAHHINTN